VELPPFAKQNVLLSDQVAFVNFVT